jgi:hypothetical protein
MKNIVKLLVLVLFVFSNFAFSQTAKIKTEALSPHRLEALEFTTNSVSTGLNVVPNLTYVYLSAWNIGNDEPIITATFTLTSQPATSTAGLEEINPTWVQFKPDIKGTYEIELSITTASGSHDTTAKIYAADFVGVGKFEDVNGTFPKCMTCHSSDFADIFNNWKVSGHANVFNQQVETSDHYSTNCMKCHTTGYDHNLAAENNGFDDIAASLGWAYGGAAADTIWETIISDYPNLVNHATIGCESCHGPGSLHAAGESQTETIAISLEDGACAQCHDEPWRHNKVSEYENSLHSEALWSSSFARTFTDNSIGGNCARCHEGEGFVSFTKGEVFSGADLTEADHIGVTCATCHDPHGNSNEFSLRDTPAGSDTLGNGYQYTGGGTGRLCMNCHKARRDNVSYIQTANMSSHWGPHHSTQADVLLGQNAAEFDGVFNNGNHKDIFTNACVDCHMIATTDTGTVTRDRVGGHSFSLHDADNDYYHATACVSCHPGVTNWDDFEADTDYDADGVVESVPQEIAGLEALLVNYLPPVGEPSIDYNLIDTDVLKKAYWNYQLIAYDGSGGMHNAKFAVDVLTQSIIAIGGVVPVELISFKASVSDNAVSLNWHTATETNNSGFEVQKKSGNNWQAIGFVEGNGTTTSNTRYSFTDNIGTQSGKIYYRLKQIDYDGTFEYSKEIFVDVTNGPTKYALSQNYPNPFNPTTTIKYSLPFNSNVKVVVYNITGEVVKELVNSVQEAGFKELSFNSDGLNMSSGIYFYSIEAASIDGSKTFKQTKKMVLLK